MQLYRPTSAELELAIANSILPKAKNYVEVAIGIYAGNIQQPKSLTEIQQQMDAVRQHGYGYAIFSGKTSLGILRLDRRREKERYSTTR